MEEKGKSIDIIVKLLSLQFLKHSSFLLTCNGGHFELQDFHFQPWFKNHACKIPNISPPPFFSFPTPVVQKAYSLFISYLFIVFIKVDTRWDETVLSQGVMFDGHRKKASNKLTI